VPRLRLGQDDVRFELRGVRCGLPTIRPEPCFSLPTAPFLNPDISDAEARLAGARLHHAGVGSQIRTFARMDAMASDKTARSERLLG
jgi:hypothetical protein